MTQKMSAGVRIPITYYRKYSGHATHEASGQFTRDSKANYASFNNILLTTVTEGTYKSAQGVPIGGKTWEI